MKTLACVSLYSLLLIASHGCILLLSIGAHANDNPVDKLPGISAIDHQLETLPVFIDMLPADMPAIAAHKRSALTRAMQQGLPSFGDTGKQLAQQSRMATLSQLTATWHPLDEQTLKACIRFANTDAGKRFLIRCNAAWQETYSQTARGVADKFAGIKTGDTFVDLLKKTAARHVFSYTLY